ncbi:DUF1611 domain-containing protein [Burkholderia plantarii]|uniref:DUF1611 domain-containing protein n=1 Tax=Burkholderia plantarii TaxID=41899 RepID=UPI002729921B|nr:DUF1611 domain-containing protein [Burkholderia plantarii]
MKPHILVMNRWPQYRNGHPWDHELCRHDEIIPSRYAVSYLCDEEGSRGLPLGQDPARVYRVDDFLDTEALAAQVKRAIVEHGPVSHLLAFSEYLLDPAAAMRERFGIPGQSRAEVDRFRDKTLMKRILQAADLRVPRWFACTTPDETEARARELGFPLILKPIRGASSKGVRKLDSIDALRAALATPDLGQYEIEEYIDGEILHVDGVLDRAGRCMFLCVSRYISSCLDFEAGVPLGSVIQTDTPLARACRAFALACLRALELRGSAFHLELFSRHGELVFLEIGARVPGADVPYTVDRAFGVNLFRLWVDAALDLPASLPVVSPPRSAGWVTIPRPAPLPRRVVSAGSLLGRVPGLYRELIPAPGDLLTDTGGGYTHLQGGRFLIEGANEREVLASIREIVARYELSTTPVSAASVDFHQETPMRTLTHAELLAKRCVVFAEGCFGLFTSKVAASYLRYRPESALAVIDSTQAGKRVSDVIGYGGEIPVVASVEEALAGKPEVLLIGKGLHSAQLPPGWKVPLLTAIRSGLHVINCIHFRLRSDPDLAAAIDEAGITVWETKEPVPLELNKARVLALPCFVAHTCGSDSNIGKKTAALEISLEANRRGIRTGFAATGQTGMLISGTGIVVDCIPSDFVAGAAEKVVLDAAEGNDWVVLEGQGSLNHIGASGIALALLHGGLPHALIFCHRLGLERTKVWDTKLRPIPELIRLNEALTVFERPAKVVAISVNSAGLSDADYRAQADALARETGLPVVDPCRDGAGLLVDALLAYQKTLEAAPHAEEVTQ